MPPQKASRGSGVNRYLLPVLQITEEAVQNSYRLRINSGPLSPPLIDHSDGDEVGISLMYPFHLSVPGIRKQRVQVWLFFFSVDLLLKGKFGLTVSSFKIVCMIFFLISWQCLRVG